MATLCLYKSGHMKICISMYICVCICVCVYVDMKIGQSQKHHINNLSQGHNLLSLCKWLQALAFFSCVQLIVSFSLFLKSLGKTKYSGKNINWVYKKHYQRCFVHKMILERLYQLSVFLIFTFPNTFSCEIRVKVICPGQGMQLLAYLKFQCCIRHLQTSLTAPGQSVVFLRMWVDICCSH